MKKTSKSLKIIPSINTNSNYAAQFKSKANANASTIQYASDIEDKVNESKPILETIYNKVRKKEQIYKQLIKRNDQRCQQSQELAGQFKELARQAFTVIHQTRLNKVNTQKEHSIQTHKEGQCRRYQSVGNLHCNNVLNSILSQYQTTKQKQNRETQSVYQKYIRKLQENKQNKRVPLINAKNQQDNTLTRVRRLSKEIDEDLQQLKLKRNASSTSVMHKQKPSILQNGVHNKDRKSYFLQMQKRKLKLL